MASGGYGRGGRGAALLQALSQPVRKPGETDESQQGAPKVSAAGAAPPPAVSAPTAAPMGRGAFLQGLLQGARSVTPQQPQAAPGPASTKPTVPTMPGGRGVANLQALLKSAGRGGMPQQKPVQQEPKVIPSTPQEVQPPRPTPQEVQPPRPKPQEVQPPHPSPMSPTSSIASSTDPPTSRFSRMALDRKEVVHRSGSDGERISISGNYIRIKCLNAGVYQYHVSFSPNIDSKNMRFRMVNEHKNVIGDTKAFDGAILYLPIKLNQETVLHSKRITDGTDVVITIRLTKVVPPQQCVPLYNIIFRRIMHVLEMVQVGRYFYNPKTPSSVPQHKLEVWPGYITAVQENEGGLMLLADASHRVLRTETVLQVMSSIFQKNPTGFQNECTNVLVGNIVLTRYNNKTYRVDDIIWAKTPLDTFESSSGNTMTFLEYYKKSYNKDITDHEQPLLLHRPKKKKIGGEERPQKLEAICLIPELCYMTGLTDDLRKDFTVTKDLGSHTRVNPQQRVLTMKKFVNSVNSNPEAKKELTNWGLSLEEETLNTEGRVVPMERIHFGGNRSELAGDNADWGREATRNKVITAVDLINWIVIYTKKDTQRANEYINMTMKCCPQMGISCNPPTRFEIRDDRTETYIRSLRDNINQSVQVVVVIFPSSRDDRYSAVKKLCCVECPVPSQVIISRTIGKPQKLRSVTQKIALQINCKLGGELWGLDIPFKTLMVVGIDVYHDAARGKRSIAGFVSSTNKMCTRWYSRTCFQLPGQELVDGLKVCFTSAIRKFHEVNHLFPGKIVVFRDGVGDGDLPYIQHEVQQLEQCFSQFGEEYQPMMNVVIVQKRINTRIFRNGNKGFENPPPGTIVDHTITRREWYDFFLVSQHVTQGTVSPTHYICVHDRTNIKPDHLQRLTYKMTHLYYNWPGTVRVPAPCQYAHKLAYLVGQNIHKEPSTELSDRLFFL